jgi:hypothetical protein
LIITNLTFTTQFHAIELKNGMTQQLRNSGRGSRKSRRVHQRVVRGKCGPKLKSKHSQLCRYMIAKKVIHHIIIPIVNCNEGMLKQDSLFSPTGLNNLADRPGVGSAKSELKSGDTLSFGVLWILFEGAWNWAVCGWPLHREKSRSHHTRP